MALFEGISLAITAGRELIDLPALGPSELLAMGKFCERAGEHSTLQCKASTTLLRRGTLDQFIALLRCWVRPANCPPCFSAEVQMPCARPGVTCLLRSAS